MDLPYDIQLIISKYCFKEFRILNKKSKTIADKNIIKCLKPTLENACIFNNNIFLKYCLKKGANDWDWGLESACLGGHKELANLMIEKGRHKNIRPEERYCKTCTQEIEDEEHFILKCTKYEDLRTNILLNYVNTNNKNFISLNDGEKLVYLMTSEKNIVNKLGKFCTRVFNMREAPG